MKRIVITGGHLTPAVAVIDKLPKDVWEVIFIGRKYALEGEKTLSAEYKTVNDLGIKFLSITTGRLQRSLTRYTLFSLIKIPVGFWESFYWLLKFRPRVILSFGSYVALPVALAGWVLRIPVITHEQSVMPGLATKLISRISKKVCVSWPKTLEIMDEEKGKFFMTGNPIRPEIFNFQFSIFNKNPIFQFSNEKNPLIYITGGSLGAHAINETVGQVLSHLLKKYRLIHQCGDAKAFNDYENLKFQMEHLSPELRQRYFLTKYIDSQDIGWVLNNADLVISRAGANTVCELAALGKPAILIPLPWAGQSEQLENAKLLEEAGTAIILPQEKLTSETLYQCINTLIQEIDKYKGKAERAKKLVRADATERLIGVISEVSYETRQ